MEALTKIAAVFEALKESACAIQSGDMSRADLVMKRALDHLTHLAHSRNKRLVNYIAQTSKNVVLRAVGSKEPSRVEHPHQEASPDKVIYTGMSTAPPLPHTKSYEPTNETGMSFTRGEHENSPSWRRKLNFTYDGLVQPNMTKQPTTHRSEEQQNCFLGRNVVKGGGKELDQESSSRAKRAGGAQGFSRRYKGRMDKKISLQLPYDQVNNVQGALSLPHGSSAPNPPKSAGDQNLLTSSSMRDIDLNVDITLDTCQFNKQTVGDDMDVQCSPPQQVKYGSMLMQTDIAKPSTTYRNQTRHNSFHGSKCSMLGLEECDRAKRPKESHIFTDAVGLAQGSSREPEGRRVRQKLMEGRKSAWSEKNVKDYLIWPITLEEENLLQKWRRREFSGQVEIKLGGWEVKDISLAPLVFPLNNVIIQNMPKQFYIDDTVINAYFHLLKRRCGIYPNMYLKHYSFTCFTASKLFSKQAEDLSTWFQPEDLKGACKLFLPLRLPNSSHWVLFCVDINNRQFLWLDSLENSRKSHGSEMRVILKWFVECVLPHLDNKDASKWTSRVPEDIPTQENLIDCGIFVMKYADCLTHGDSFPFSQADMPHFRRRVFLDLLDWNIHVPHRFTSN